jgi:hypothetical protein
MLKFKVTHSPDGGYVWKRAVWPFPAFPNPLDQGTLVPRFNPANHDDAPF